MLDRQSSSSSDPLADLAQSRPFVPSPNRVNRKSHVTSSRKKRSPVCWCWSVCLRDFGDVGGVVNGVVVCGAGGDGVALPAAVGCDALTSHYLSHCQASHHRSVLLCPVRRRTVGRHDAANAMANDAVTAEPSVSVAIARAVGADDVATAHLLESVVVKTARANSPRVRVLARSSHRLPGQCSRCCC